MSMVPSVPSLSLRRFVTSLAAPHATNRAAFLNFCWQGRRTAVHGQPPTLVQQQLVQHQRQLVVRTLASQKTKKKREKERQWQLRKNEEQRTRRQDASLRNLHPAAKMKRILSALDFWFSEGNLRDDVFLQNELLEYRGHVRLTTLATFPKIRRLDQDGLEHLIYNTCTSQAAAGRYSVIFNQELVEKVALNTKRRERRAEQERQHREHEMQQQAKAHKKWRKSRLEKLKKYLNNTREEWFLPRWKQELKERYWEDKEEEQKESLLLGNLDNHELIPRVVELFQTKRQLILAKKYPTAAAIATINADTDSDMDTGDDAATDITKATAITTTTEPTMITAAEPAPEIAANEEIARIDAMTVDDIDWQAYSDFEFEYELEESIPTFADAQREYELLTSEIDEEYNNDRWEWKMEREYKKLVSSYAEEDNDTIDDIELLDIQGRDDPNKTQEEVLPQLPIDDDGSTMVKYALVKHKRITLAYLDSILEPDTTSGYSDDDDDNEYIGGIDAFGGNDEEWNEYKVEEETSKEKKKKHPQQKEQSLPKYSSSRPVKVIQNAESLRNFCRHLTNSLEQYSSKNNNASTPQAIGFDVEYCSLEGDIRTTLPAMLQLASPRPNGPVGLIWLDKFPNHGKDLLAGQDEEYKDLFKILKDPLILKVGVGASGDAKNLIEWWGINDSSFMDFYIRGVENLEMEAAGGANTSLQGLCALVLQMDLPKLKEKNAKQKKQQRKKGKRLKTSHWRRNDMTKEMKQYAAHDASCAIDVWLQLRQLRE